MSDYRPTNAGRQMFGDIAPKLAELSDDVLFGDVWERPQLSKRDRSLITCAALVALGRTDQMNSHFPRGSTTSDAGRTHRDDHAHGFLFRLANRRHGRDTRKGVVREEADLNGLAAGATTPLQIRHATGRTWSV